MADGKVDVHLLREYAASADRLGDREQSPLAWKPAIERASYDYAQAMVERLSRERIQGGGEEWLSRTRWRSTTRASIK